MNLIDDIKQIPNTGKLLVVWQEPKSSQPIGSGKRFIVGEILYNNKFEQINYFVNSDIEMAKKCGFRKLDVFAEKEGLKLKNKEISQALKKRVITRQREDFDSYLKSYMISPKIKDEIDTLTLLANTGRGKNFGDGYSFYPYIKNTDTPFQITFGIAGHRHSDGMKQIDDKLAMKGKDVILKIENNNEFDPHAIEVLLGDIKIGYVPKGLSEGLHMFVKSNKINAFIARVNGTKERPNLTVLAKLLV